MTSAELRAIVREVFHEEFKASRSIKKNGESVPVWFFSKILPFDRLLLIGALLYTLGSKATLITTDTATALRTAAKATEQTEAVSRQVQALSDFVMQQSGERTEEMKATRKEVADLRERVNVTATRGELRDTVQKEILPRLQRIEQKVGQP